MNDSPLSPPEIWDAARAYSKLEPKYRDALAASFLERVDHGMAARAGADWARRYRGGRGSMRRGRPGRPLTRSAVLRPVRWCADPLLLAAVALASDAVYRRIPFRIWTTGPVDEVAHLSTAALGLLVLARFIDAPRRFYSAALIASVAIDADHIPLYLGLLGNRTQRPVTHSLTTVAVSAAAAAASRRHRAVLAGVATGLALHFARDIDSRPGMQVFWPLEDTSWMVRRRWFLGMIVLFTTARLMLVHAGLPHARVPVFQTPSRSG